MNEEFKENLEVTEEKVQKDAVHMESQQEDTVEEYIPETVHAESVVEIEPEVQPEAVLTQAADGTWRHAEDSPFSPFYVPDRKQKSSNRLTIGLLALLILLLVVGLIFAVSKLIEAAVGEATVAWNESSSAVEEFIAGVKEEFKEKNAEEAVPDMEKDQDDTDTEESPNIPLPEEPELPDSYEDYLEDYLKRYYGNEYGYTDPGDDEYGDYTEDGFHYEDGMYVPYPEDDYYLELADSLRDDLSYTVEFEDYTHSDYDNSVYLTVWYAEVSEDVKNSSRINELLMDNAMYYAYMFESDDISDLVLEVESFVTYMDEEILSVAVNEYYNLEGEVYYNLYCMNFDLKTGTLLNNTDIIEVSDELVDAFIEQSIYQNGYTSSVSDYSKEEIADFMSDEDSLILFYSPVGLEIGYNHPNGWVSVTLKEYKQFLRKL